MADEKLVTMVNGGVTQQVHPQDVDRMKQAGYTVVEEPTPEPEPPPEPEKAPKKKAGA